MSGASEAVFRLIEDRRPATIFHLAAQSLPTVSWEKPQETMETNVVGTVNLFEAIKAVRRRDPAYDPCVVVACSSAEYGASLTPERFPVDEDAPLLPLHPYGVSKVAQDLLTLQYWINDRIRGVRTRIFNTTGPRKQNDVVSDFAARAARVARHGGTLAVGNSGDAARHSRRPRSGRRVAGARPAGTSPARSTTSAANRPIGSVT